MAEKYSERVFSIAKDNLVVTGLLATIVAGIAWTVHDFRSWKDFGTGGTPPTWAGYWRMTKIRINHTLSTNNLYDPSPLSTSSPTYLKTPLPTRTGPRPKIISRTMPQRQHPTPIPAPTRSKLQNLMQTLASSHPKILYTKPSHTEGKSTDGLYAVPDTETLNPIARDRVLDHEIAHAHPAENSLHVWLSDGDARAVIEAGWGLRFPLAFVKSGWTMVYAPRDEGELEVVEGIVRAGVEFITGVAI
ncbi:hypothetical protein E2P81_ATG02517 [Venturia nashicola]|uniref:Luciferase domain-containing protein n=1 Tax=Venturia nashicola TaxID=86259 RepID=A0A4Z1PNI6_9PEZI|nr:hypothetical protein E6O75_ATG02577 [Venturia nashicola]TLD36735.1 hypothetical protein E2P81_ATG02517 [Venturia nashicola]